MSCSYKILAIETSTTACSAALQVGDEVVEQFEIAPRQHSDLILAMVDQLLVDAGITLSQLDSIAFARGPGAFTGLRIAAGVVQGLAFAADLPVTPVSTLAAMAHGAFCSTGTNKILVANDAGMNEVYFGAYQVTEFGKAQLVGSEHVIPISAISEIEGNGWLAIGSGWESYAEQVPAELQDKIEQTQIECYPHAKDVVDLAQVLFSTGKFVLAEEAVPIYLRDKVVGN